MNELKAKLWQYYTAATGFQKKVAALVLAIASTFVMYGAFLKTGQDFQPCPFVKQGGEFERQEMKLWLRNHGIVFKESGGQLLVPASQIDWIAKQKNLSSHKNEGSKGFELFDTNTWIKGEKELQVLEMRALKGQLEQDLASYENILQASVILDVAPSRSLTGANIKTKASVILTLKADATLSRSQLRAITHHLTGAVRGLEPNRVAISDTKGHLYQAIAQDSSLLEDQYLIEQNELKITLSQFLDKLLGSENYHVCISNIRDQNLDITLFIDKSCLHRCSQEDVYKHILLLMKSSQAVPHVVIEPIALKKPLEDTKVLSSNTTLYLIGVSLTLGFLALAGYPWLSLLMKKRGRKKELLIADLPPSVDMKVLSDSLCGEDPKTLALMLSYLETHKAEEILAGFPAALQEAVLSELEKVS
jgi:flagellar M-ring protein FliF